MQLKDNYFQKEFEKILFFWDQAYHVWSRTYNKVSVFQQVMLLIVNGPGSLSIYTIIRVLKFILINIVMKIRRCKNGSP